MPVIAHQAIAPEVNVELFVRGGEQFQELSVIVRPMKERLPMVAPVEDMEAAPLKMTASQTRHDFL